MIFIPGIWFVNTWPLIALCHSLLMSSQYNHGDLWNTYIQIHSVHACGMACGNDNPLHHRYHYLWLCDTYIYNYIGFFFFFLGGGGGGGGGEGGFNGQSTGCITFYWSSQWINYHRATLTTICILFVAFHSVFIFSFLTEYIVIGHTYTSSNTSS